MEMKPLTCDGCGAPLQAPNAGGIAVCDSCGLRSMASSSRVVRPDADSAVVRQIQLERTLSRFDRELELQRQTRMVANPPAAPRRSLAPYYLLGPALAVAAYGLTRSMAAASIGLLAGLAFGVLASVGTRN